MPTTVCSARPEHAFPSPAPTRRSAGLAILSILALPTFSTRLAAQTPTAPIVGVVRDTGGRGIAGVEVILLRPPLSTTTDAEGRFRLADVPVGARRLLVRRIGYAPMHPLVTVPQLGTDSLFVVMIPAPQRLPPVVVESDRPGLRGVVGDTGYHAIPRVLVELLGARRADTTDEQGRWAIEGLKPGSYMLRITHPAYYTRMLSVFVDKSGQDYAVLLDRLGEGKRDRMNSHQAVQALEDLGHRLAWQPRRYRLTRSELERYGETALCDIPILHGQLGEFPNIIEDGMSWRRNQSLCTWSADEVELVEWGAGPCADVTGSIAFVLQTFCGVSRQRSITGRRPVGAGSGGGGGSWVVLWMRN